MRYGILLVLSCILLSGCQSKGSSQPDVPQSAAEAASPTALTNVQAETAPDPTPAANPGLDVSLISSQSERAIAAFTHGSYDVYESDFMPISSDSSGFSQKWEFYLYTKPYQTRVKFEVSSVAFTKNEGKVRGYVKNTETGEKYNISQTLKSGHWSAGKSPFALDFGDYHLRYDSGMFHLEGSFEKGTFEYDIPAHFWKPGTGDVYFGNRTKDIFRYMLLSYHQDVARGVVHIGEDVPVTGRAYANHYVMTKAVYDVFDEVSDFRRLTDDYIVEFRYYVPNEKYDAPSFGFLLVAYDGTPVLSTTDFERTPEEQWLDEDNYGYVIDARQLMVGREGNNTARLVMHNVHPVPSDPYADLSTFERNVAMRFAKPIEYTIGVDWELQLSVDGMEALVPFHENYSLTRLH